MHSGRYSFVRQASQMPRQRKARKPARLPKVPKTTVANDDSKRWHGGRGSRQNMEKRANACYVYILEGGTRRQIVTKIHQRFNVSMITAYEDYKRAMDYLYRDESHEKHHFLKQIQALRLVAIQRALKNNNLQVVATLLKDLGATLGEVSPQTLAAQAPNLNLIIEPPALSDNGAGQLPASSAAEPLGDGEFIDVSEEMA